MPRLITTVPVDQMKVPDVESSHFCLLYKYIIIIVVVVVVVVVIVVVVIVSSSK